MKSKTNQPEPTVKDLDRILTSDDNIQVFRMI